MRRFVPDFKTLAGDAKVTIGIKDFPSSTQQIAHIVLLLLRLQQQKKIQEQEVDMLV